MKENTDAVWPVTAGIGKNFVTSALMNRKAYQKSRETGTPWIVHPLTGRVLPWPGEPRWEILKEGPGRFELILPGGSAESPYGDGMPTASGRSGETQNTAAAPPSGGVLAELGRIIAERRNLGSEGSYTAHLFEQGMDKIRKKTGEEAVELLLAREPEHLISEAADLVYHLLVLLEAADLSWDMVEGELARRR